MSPGIARLQRVFNLGRSHRKGKKALARIRRLRFEPLEPRQLLSADLWVAAIRGVNVQGSLDEQSDYGRSLLVASGVPSEQLLSVRALDYTGSFVLQTATGVTEDELENELSTVPGFAKLEEFDPDSELALKYPSGTFTGPDDGSGGAPPGDSDPTPPPAGTWITSTTAPTSIGTIMLLSDGTVLAQGGGVTNRWYKLTPSPTTGYAGGTWSPLATMGLQRLYGGSNVLPDGRVFFLGGEYSGPLGSANWSNTGEIYDPVANTWTATAPFPRSAFGDGQTEVLPDGRILAGYLSGPETYIYDPATDIWSAGGAKLRNDRNNEETWNLLRDGSLLTYEIFSSTAAAAHAQRYVPALNAWVDAGTPPGLMSGSAFGSEMGPSLLLPDGRAFLVGANNTTALYTPATDSTPEFWTAGPPLPANLGADDAPGAILPDGHVVFAVDTSSPTIFTGPTRLFDFDPTTNSLSEITGQSGFPSQLTTDLNHSAFTTRMLLLPTGQMLFNPSASGRLYLYTPGGSPDDSWRPAISSVTSNGDGSYTLTGTQLNGISEGASYGDDAGAATNFPIVRLTNLTTGNVYYGRTYDWSAATVATGETPIATKFTLPVGLPAGNYALAAVANGIDSAPVTFSVPLTVTSSSPANGSVVFDVPPASYTISFSGPIDPATLQASDLLVNNLPADSVLLSRDQTSATFAYLASPVIDQGVQTIALAAGSVTADGDSTAPLAGYVATFRYDAPALAVVSTSPPALGILSLPSPISYVVNFNEPIAPNSLSTDDLTLSIGTVASVVATGTNQATYTITNITDEGSITVTLGAGKVTDASGNPNVDSFSSTYTLDYGVTAFPTPLTSKNPPGSLIYDPVQSGQINFVGDTDIFTIALDPGQKISAVVLPGSSTLQPTITLLDPANATLATATAAAVNQAAQIQSASTTTAGTYSLVVGGAGGTLGSYTVQIYLNSALEAEGTISGVTNDIRGTAQSIATSFLTLANTQTTLLRGAVVGGNAAATSWTDYYSFATTAANESVAVAFKHLSGSGASVFLENGSGTVLATGTTGPTNFDQGINNLVIATAGTYYLRVSGAAAATYSAVITRGAAIEREANDTAATAQDISATNKVIGAILGPVAVVPSALATTETNSGNSFPFSGTATARYQQIYTSSEFDQGGVIDALRFRRSSGQATFTSSTINLTVKLSYSAHTVDTASSTFAANVGAGQVTVYSGPLVLSSSSASATPQGFDVVLDIANTFTYNPALGDLLLDITETQGSTSTFFLGASPAGAQTTTTRIFSTNSAATTGTIGATSTDHRAYGLVTRFDFSHSGATLDNFDAGSGALANYTFTSTNNASITAAAAHDGAFGLQLGNPTEWMYRTDTAAQVQQGDVLSWWMQANGSPTSGRGYLGFGASSTGTYALVMAGNSSQLMLQKVSPFTTFSTLSSVTQSWTANKWYRFEVAWGVGGLLTGRVFDSDGVTLLNTVKAVDTSITSGGIAFRGFGPTWFVDTAQKTSAGFDEDWYSTTLTAGTTYRFETATPADGGGQFVNTLNPKLQLFDSTGALIATGAALQDGRNESLSYTPPTSGTYKVRLASDSLTMGEYILTRSTADTVGPRVIATSVAPGAVLSSSSAPTITITFSEPMNTSITSSAFTLHANFRNSNFSTSTFSFNAAGTVLTLPFGTLPDDSYTLTLNSNSTSLRDVAGNLLDGEFSGTFPSGNGTAGGNFALNFAEDTTTEALGPLLPAQPLGSLIYDPTYTRVIAYAGDTDNFTFALDPGQKVSVLVTPLVTGLQPAVTIKDPLSVTLGSDSAGLAGQNAVLQSVDTTTGGIYTVTVSSVSSTTGSYTIQLLLNGSFEQESNDTIDEAQSIDESFSPLAAPDADRGAVLGDFSDIATYDVNSVPFSFTDISTTGTSRFSTGNDNVAIVNASLGFTFNFYGTDYTTVNFSTNGLITFGASNTSASNATLASNPPQAAIAPFWDDLLINNSAANASMRTQLIGTAPNRQYILQWDKVTFVSGGLNSDPITFQAILSENGSTIQFNYLDLVSDSAPGNDGGSATVGVKAANPVNGKFVEVSNNSAASPFVGSGLSVLLTPVTTVDYYALTLAAGQTASLAVTGQTAGNLAFDLRGLVGASPVETVLAAGQSDATNLTLRIASFTAPAAGTYFVRVEGDLNTVYSLLVTRDAAIDAEPNDSYATAQDITGLKAVVGDLETSAVNFADSGWWDATGAHTATNKNYIASKTTTTEFHNYFVFDLTGVTQTITGAQLRLTNGTTGVTGTPSYTLFDVSTPLASLQATGAGQTGVFADLGSGVAYGTASFTTADNATIAMVQWNDAGIAALNAARGGLFAVGGAITSVASGSQFVFGSSGNTADVRQLVLTFAPEDWYAVNISAAAPNLVLSTATPADGKYQFTNNLDPNIELYDPAGNLVAAPATVLADGRNESLIYHAAGLAPGTYRVRVTTNGSSPGGEYVLRSNALPNAAPLASDDNAISKEDFASVIDVLANDGDADGTVDATTVEIGAGPGHGTVAIDSLTGKITYTPSGNYNGADSFTYRVKDDNGAWSNMATVNLAIAPVTDVTGFDVEQGAIERSFVRYLDLIFESPDNLDAIMAPSRTQLTRYDLDGNSHPALVSLAGVVSHAPGSPKLAFDFGTQGLGGNRNTTSGDGYYVLAVDTDGDGILETKRAFYRLFGDVNGDRAVTDADINQIFAALGASGANVNEDINGDGVVNAIDRTYAIRSRGRKLADGLWLDD